MIEQRMWDRSIEKRPGEDAERRSHKSSSRNGIEGEEVLSGSRQDKAGAHLTRLHHLCTWAGFQGQL